MKIPPKPDRWAYPRKPVDQYESKTDVYQDGYVAGVMQGCVQGCELAWAEA